MNTNCERNNLFVEALETLSTNPVRLNSKRLVSYVSILFLSELGTIGDRGLSLVPSSSRSPYINLIGPILFKVLRFLLSAIVVLVITLELSVGNTLVSYPLHTPCVPGFLIRREFSRRTFSRTSLSMSFSVEYFYS